MNQDEITFEKLPQAVAFLIGEVNYLRTLIEKKQPKEKEKRIPLKIDEACKIISKAKSTVYTLVNKERIPCYKNGKHLYFYEDELLEWINNGKKKTTKDLNDEIEDHLKCVKRKPRRRFPGY